MSVTDLGDRLPQTLAVIEEGIGRQLHTGCQLYVSHRGSTIVDCGVGDSFPGHPMTAETINVWLSAGKPITAVAILKLWEQYDLRLDDPVTTYIPEFANGGKESITIRHLLTHTGGFRTVETGWPEVPWEESIRRICEASLEPDWIIGKTAGYHTTTSWFILGEIIARQSGQPFAEAVQREIFEPLGLVDSGSWLNPSQIDEYGDRIGRMYARERGELQMLDWHHSLRLTRPSPGASFFGPIRELGHFYEMLFNEGKARNGRILSPQSVAAMTARHRVGLYDLTFAHIVDFGLGVILDSNHYGAETIPYGYGRYCSTRTFGHGGSQSSQGWCDPEAGLVVAYFFNGRPGEAQHNRRTRLLNEAIYTDLKLV